MAQPTRRATDTKTKDKGGRPPKLNGEAMSVFLKHIGDGDSLRVAALLAGFSVASAYAWIATGKEDRAANRRTAHRRFLDGYSRARAMAENRYLGKVRDIADKREKDHVKLSAAKFMLSVLDRKRYSESNRNAPEGPPPIERAELLDGINELAVAVQSAIEDDRIPRDRLLAVIQREWRQIARTRLGLTIGGDADDGVEIFPDDAGLSGQGARTLPPSTRDDNGSGHRD